MAEPFDALALLKSLLQAVPELHGRLEEALDLAELVKRGALPAAPVSGFLIPTGLRPLGPGDAASGAYTQGIDELFALVLVLRGPGDVTGGRLRPRLNALVWSVVSAVAGRDGGEDENDAVIGVFRLVGSRTLSLTAGAAIVQIDFAIQLQLRTLS